MQDILPIKGMYIISARLRDVVAMEHKQEIICCLLNGTVANTLK